MLILNQFAGLWGKPVCSCAPVAAERVTRTLWTEVAGPMLQLSSLPIRLSADVDPPDDSVVLGPPVAPPPNSPPGIGWGWPFGPGGEGWGSPKPGGDVGPPGEGGVAPPEGDWG
jgi:hypothetical protein